MRIALIPVVVLLLLSGLPSSLGECGCSASRKQNENLPADKEPLENDVESETRTDHLLSKNIEDEEFCAIPDEGSAPGEGGSAPGEGGCGAKKDRKGMVLLEGGQFKIGTDKPGILSDGEHPSRPVSLSSFWLDKLEVSNWQFLDFVKKKRHTTEAETLKDSFVLASMVKDISAVKGAVQAVPWWLSVRGADWRHPEGPGSDIDPDRWDHPVVHVTWNDAKAFCEYHNKRLPTEAEWEVACKKSLDGHQFPWNDTITADEQSDANIWQGEFPHKNTESDGFLGTAPVQEYKEGRGLPVKNMIGNVWEWTSDWWTTDHTGGLSPPKEGVIRVKKGGSFMCHASYCFRYRCEARSENTPDTSASNIGFRCAADA